MKSRLLALISKARAYRGSALAIALVSVFVHSLLLQRHIHALEIKPPSYAVIDPQALEDARSHGHKLGAPILTFAGDLAGSSMTSQTVSGLTGSGGVVTASAGTIKETGSTLSLADNGSVVRDQFDLTHGRITAGGGGTDALAVFGPLVGAEGTYSAEWYLAHGGTASGTNWNVAGNGTDIYLNAATGGLVTLKYNGNPVLSLNGAANLLQFDPSLSSATIGTNNPSGTLKFQVGSATDWGTLSANGLSLGANIAPTLTTAATAGVWRLQNNVAGQGTAIIQNSSSSGYPIIEFHDNLDANQASFGYYSPIPEFRFNGYGNGAGIPIDFYVASNLKASVKATGVALGDTASANTITGSLAFTTRTITTNFTIDTTTTDRTIWANTTSAAFTVTLPAPTAGREIIFVDSAHQWGTHNLTIARHGTETINGVAGNLTAIGSGVSGVNECCRVVSDGVNWQSDCR